MIKYSSIFEKIRVLTYYFLRIVLRDSTLLALHLIATKDMVEINLNKVQLKDNLIRGKAVIFIRDADGRMINKLNESNLTLPIRKKLPSNLHSVTMTFSDGLFNSLEYITDKGVSYKSDFYL